MSKKFLTSIDLSKNQILNTVVHNETNSSNISSPSEGQIFYDTNLKRLFYYNGTAWVGADSNDAISQLNGNAIVDYINSENTTKNISIEKLSKNSITIGETSIKLGATVSNLSGTTVNDISLSKNTVGFSISGGATTKTLKVEDNTTIKTNSIELANNKTLTLTGSLDIGGANKTGKITISSNDDTDRSLTLTNTNLELAGSGTKLTINNTPTIQGTGKVTLGVSSDISLYGDKSATLNADLTIGTTHQYSKSITLKTTESNDTPDVVAIFPKVGSLTLVGVDTTQDLTNKKINGLTITTATGKTLDLSKASLTIGSSSTGSGNITIQSDSGTNRTLTLSGSPTIGGDKTANLLANLSVGISSSNEGQVNIRSAGADQTTIIGPNNGTVTLPAGTLVETGDSRLHTQGTDAGTSNATFQVGTNGIKLKSSLTGGENIELQVRDSADLSLANIRVKNLYVEGTQTVLNSEELNIKDNIIVLNSGVENKSENSDAGIEIHRYKNITSETPEEQPVSLIFNESTGKWIASYINKSNESRDFLPIAFKYSETFGDGASTSFNIYHNLNTKDLSVSIREVALPYAEVIADVYFTTDNYITIGTSTAPTANQYRVTIIG